MKRKIFFYFNLTLLFIVSISCVHEQYRSVDTGGEKVFVTFNPTNILTTGTETQINKFRMIAFNSGGSLELNKKQSEMDSPSKDLYKLELRPGMYTLYGIGNEPDDLLAELDDIRTPEALDALKLGDVRSIVETNLPLIWKKTIYIRATGIDASVGQVSLTNSPDDSGWSSTLPMQMERMAAKISIAARKGNPNEEINMTKVQIRRIPAYTTFTPSTYPVGEVFYLNSFGWGGPKLITGDADSYTELVKGQIVAENIPATEARKTVISLEYTRNGIAESAEIPFDGNVDRNKLYQYQIKITGIKVEIENIVVLPWNEISDDATIVGAEISFSRIEVPYSFGQESKVYFTTKNIPPKNLNLLPDLYTADGKAIAGALTGNMDGTRYTYNYNAQTKSGQGILFIKRSVPSIVKHQIRLNAAGMTRGILIDRLGVAGSNIYWDVARKQLVFDDVPREGERAPHDMYQGVFFFRGSLVAIPGGFYKSGPLRSQIWSATGDIRPNASIDRVEGKLDDKLFPFTPDANIGDICLYMTRRGWAPKGKKWKSPTTMDLYPKPIAPITYSMIGNPAVKPSEGSIYGDCNAASGLHINEYVLLPHSYNVSFGNAPVVPVQVNISNNAYGYYGTQDRSNSVMYIHSKIETINTYSGLAVRCVVDDTPGEVTPLYVVSYDLSGSDVGTVTAPTPEGIILNQHVDAGRTCTLNSTKLIASSLARHVGWEIDGKIFDLGATITNINKDLIAKPVWLKKITKIGDLYWTNGNLISDGTSGCQIGDAMDGGLYFQFGSLIGWPGSSNSNGTGNGGSLPLGKPVVQPEDCNYGVADYTSTSKIHNDMTPIPLYAPKTRGTRGIGDPCRYYLGEAWRLPTQQELVSVLGTHGSQSIPWDNLSNWTPQGKWNNTSIGYVQHIQADFRFIAAGNRNYWDGAIANIGTKGFIWSSSFEEQPFGLGLNITSDSGNPKDSSSRPNGFPVRCVSSINPY